MRRLILIATFTLTSLAPVFEAAHAGSTPLLNRDGTAGHLAPLGEGIGIYSNPHGNHAIVTTPGTLRPHGDTGNDTPSTFGTPNPPNNLTPAPVLPLSPNRPLLSAPPSPPAPATSSGSTGGGGRFGR